jgi:hypothetical protein
MTSEYQKKMIESLKNFPSKIRNMSPEELDRRIEKYQTKESVKSMINDHGGLLDSQLLPCPLCGGEAAFDQLGTGRQCSVVSCQECGCRVEANEVGCFNGCAWNRRVPAGKVRKAQTD